MNVLPKLYAESNTQQLRHSNELINLIIEENCEKQFSNIIDIGCGCGNVTYNLFKYIKPKSLLGIDKDPEMINYAVKNYSAPQIHYEVQDFGVPFQRMNNSIKELSGKTSLIFSNECLHWINDQETAAKNIAQLLSDDGKLYCIMSLSLDLCNIMTNEEMEKCGKFIKIPSQSEQCQRWRNAFKSAGITIINENIITDSQFYTQNQFINVLIPLICNIIENYIIEDDPNKRADINNYHKYFIESKSEALFKHHPNSGPNGETMIEDNDILYQIIAEKSKINIPY